MTAIHGPMGFTDLDHEGMLIEGFDQTGTMAAIYNYPYYPEHMKRMGLRSKLSCRHKAKHSYEPHSLHICPNHLDRNFEVDAPGKVWVSDITYLHTKEDSLYLTSVIDLYDRKVVG